MGTELSLEFIEKLPKTDLHVHLDGSLRLDTIIELARQHRIKLPTFDREELFSLIYAGEICESLDDYLKAFDITLAVMQTEDSLERAAFELAEDAWREGVRHIEVRYSPMLHTREGLRLATVVEAVLRGLRMAKRTYGIRYGLILCGIRSMSAETSIRMAELCIAFKNRGVVGFDLAGSEVNNPAALHREAFQLILSNNINCTAHAGEAYGPESIAQAIHKCGAHRIGHGTRLIENGDLLNYVNDHRIPLEVCPSSNLQTKAAKSWDAHPIDFFVDYGLRVTINTDNRLLTDTTVSKELWLCHLHYGWPLETIKDVLVAGFKSAFITYRERADLLKAITAELDAIEAPQGTEDKPENGEIVYELREARETRDAKTPGSVPAVEEPLDGSEISSH
ncbi:adenosine deaminase [Haliangium ochraceum]|uniref:adenosine deaminase n=1 Tax=Haliangium ochraceum (strain DSM 14365 / JCM 11303 / SMP-2) TaxID=502025 RepID=D0LFQ6_HALO1|nr:adenosine deaminase [Haliangium ochraceum]ACY12690.1 adenosine deaminase [Haliangium ochraceum DSM 14365]